MCRMEVSPLWSWGRLVWEEGGLTMELGSRQ